MVRGKRDLDLSAELDLSFLLDAVYYKQEDAIQAVVLSNPRRSNNNT